MEKAPKPKKKITQEEAEIEVDKKIKGKDIN
jgi:hypothetical protein